MTFVLIHGGNVGASSWQRLLRFLDGDVVTVDLPGRGRRAAIDPGTSTLDDLAAAVLDDLSTSDGADAVVVAHSVGAIVVARVARLAADRIAHAVFVSPVVPPHGTCLLDHLGPDVRGAVEPTLRGGRQRPDAGAVLPLMCSDLDERATRFVASCLVDEAACLLLEPVDLSGAREVASTMVRLTDDRANPPTTQDAAARELGCAKSVDLDAGHMAMVGRPAALAAVLNDVRQRVVTASTKGGSR